MYNELGLLPLLAEFYTNKAVAPTNINKGTLFGINIREIIVIDKVAELVTLTTSQAGHGKTHALSSHRVLAKRSEHGLHVNGVIGEVKASPSQRCTLRMSSQCLERVGGSGEDVLCVEPDPALETFVFGEDTGGGSVSDETRRGFVEDLVSHGVTEGTSKVNGIQSRLGLELCQLNGLVNRNELGWEIVNGGTEGLGKTGLIYQCHSH